MAAEPEIRFDRRHWENLMKEVVNQVYAKVYDRIEAIKQQLFARRNQPIVMRQAQQAMVGRMREQMEAHGLDELEIVRVTYAIEEMDIDLADPPRVR